MVYLGTNKLNDRWLGTNLLGDKKVFPGLLDTYPATAAYSAGRRLKSDQTYAMTIRRESDNIETDIGFDANGNTDVAAIEEFGGYNLFAYTEDLTNTYWSILGITKEFNAITEDNANVQHYIRNINTDGVVGDTFTCSFSAKARERSVIQIVPRGGSFPLAHANFDLASGTISSQSGAMTVSMESDGGGWWRCTAMTTLISDLSSNTPFFLLMANSATMPRFQAYQGDGVSGLYLSKLQLTKSTTPLPYQRREAGGASDCFVPTLYDATGNGNDATQSVATEQPKIYDVETTSVVTENGKPALEFANSNLSFSDITLNTFLINCTVNADNDGGGFILANKDINNQFRIISNEEMTLFNGVTTRSDTNPGWTENQVNLTVTYSGSSLNFYRQGVSASNSVTASNSFVYNAIGRLYTSFYYSGKIQEIVIYDTDESTNRTALENNINNYYGIY